jgi:hypothetical protein
MGISEDAAALTDRQLLERIAAQLAEQAELIERFRPLLDQLGSRRGAAYVAMGWGRGRTGT